MFAKLTKTLMAIAFRLTLVLSLVVLLLSVQGVPIAYAATYTVNWLGGTIANDGVCTLREAIQEANNGSHPRGSGVRAPLRPPCF